MNSQTEWQEPTPLENLVEELSSYPIDSLPKIIREAVLAYQYYGQQPLPMIACSALANVSLACQTLANVARDRMLMSPISLYFLVVASSGERKSATDKTFGKGIRHWQSKTRAELSDEAAQQQLLHRIWQHQKEGLLKQIRKLTLNGESTLIEEQQLHELAANEPEILLLPELFFEDVTQEALVSQLDKGWPSSSLWSDEGAIVLASHGMNNSTKFIATLNRLWDGNPFITHRKTSANLNVSNRRLTLSLMLQPAILEKMLIRSDGIMRQSGFLARSLIAYPQSAMGERSYREPTDSLPELEVFYNRIQECLEKSLVLDSHGCHETPVLLFSPKAKAKWVKFFNQTEQDLIKADKWLCIQDFASKAPENVARLAALLHLFDGIKSDKISHHSVEQAINIITWHLHEAKRVLDSERGTNTHNDAKKLLAWLQRKNLTNLTPRYVQQHGPVRDKIKRDRAINTLIETHHIKKTKNNGETCLIVNPKLLNT